VFSAKLNYAISLQDNYNALHIAAMYSREDIVKILLTKKGVDPFASGGVSNW
jgi:ankyrin repeat protein